MVQVDTKAVAVEILNQLGANKFIAMTGSFNFICTENSLRMHLRTNKAKAKFLSIVLEANDTYTLTFSTAKKVMDKEWGIKVDTYVELEVLKGVYGDMLQKIFTKITGLETHL